MRKPFSKENYINHLKLLGLLATILFMCLLAYFLMWNPYALYFNRPEFSSTPYDKRELFTGSITLINFLILIGLTIFSIIKYWKQRKFVIWTPFIGLITLFILLKMNKYYPDSQYQYTKNGYQYLEQRWYLEGENTFKRFKSEKPLSNYPNHKSIIWTLDSLSN